MAWEIREMLSMQSIFKLTGESRSNITSTDKQFLSLVVSERPYL